MAVVCELSEMGCGASSIQPAGVPGLRRRRRRSSVSRARGRGGDSAVEMQHDMWVISVSHFVRMRQLKPHLELLSEGKLVRWDASMRAVFFLSHQWTSFTNPDHSTAQLRTVQSLLLRMMRGDVPKTAPAFADTMFYSADVSISSNKWKELVPDAYIWLDFISVPQMTGEEGERTAELAKAANSIPAYIERCTHFFSICPTVQVSFRDTPRHAALCHATQRSTPTYPPYLLGLT